MQLNAQTTVKDVLGAMPDSIVPYLNAIQRDELCKFANTQDTLKVKNMLNGETYIDFISNDYARIVLNNATNMQVRLLPLNDSVQIVCTVKTHSKPVAESTIAFYSTDWHRLDSTFGLPDTKDTKAMLNLLTARPDTMDVPRYNKFRDMFEPVIVSAIFADDIPAITFSLSMPLLSKEERDSAAAVIRRQSFEWTNGTFNKNL